MANFYFEYCGIKSSNISTLTSGYSPRHPDGPNKRRHKLYERSEKSEYNCKHCGITNKRFSTLTSGICPRHPKGPNKGRHYPAL